MGGKIGLYLQGGGAKGAFQVGALEALVKKEIAFDIIAGTSIGAINGMAIFYCGLHRLKDVWLEMLKDNDEMNRNLLVLETKEVVATIVDYLGTKREEKIQHFFVNYAPVENGKIYHDFKDLVYETDENIKNYVSSSSLLPNFYYWKDRALSGKTQQDIFIELIREGKYDNYVLDGGLLNNRFMEPFLMTEVEKIYAIVFEKDFQVPEVIWTKYRKDQVILIKPNFEFSERDSLLFQTETFQKWFEAGYLQAQKVMQ